MSSIEKVTKPGSGGSVMATNVMTDTAYQLERPEQPERLFWPLTFCYLSCFSPHAGSSLLILSDAKSILPAINRGDTIESKNQVGKMGRKSISHPGKRIVPT
jgi:hypothetical protein